VFLVFAGQCYSPLGLCLFGAALSVLIGSISPLMWGLLVMGAYSSVVEAVYAWFVLVLCFPRKVCLSVSVYAGGSLVRAWLAIDG
jgi:hypothetical protein